MMSDSQPHSDQQLVGYTDSESDEDEQPFRDEENEMNICRNKNKIPSCFFLYLKPKFSRGKETNFLSIDDQIFPRLTVFPGFFPPMRYIYIYILITCLVNFFIFIYIYIYIYGLLSDAEITLIDKTDGADPTRRERYWIHKLMTRHPNGLNVDESYF